ncbi:HAD family hydrolase [Reinekea marinisedimentorum]|uniref:phosphoglycolate phosphatase n=1 Tax=Reinekea marinisedimentorum TaxID=230495 RepID=A0A4R3HUI7_9GAMM|nr:HAD family hydrolase [Reinekea marinisedimentorum]TCS36772.1 putative hydrolase of the HAD superfamily [Reinekea marinisedimentorum]
MIQLVIFDLGETLISYQGVPLNWSSHYRSAINRALDNMALSADGDQLLLATSILSFYNTRTSPRQFEVSESEVISKVASVFNADDAEFEAQFFGYFQRKAYPEPSAEATLSKLKSCGVKLSVLSDVPYGMPKQMLLDDLGSLKQWFDDVSSSCEVGFRKPHPVGLLNQIRKHGVSISTTAFVGNEAKDIECALNAGVRSILLDITGEKQFGQDYSIKTLDELLSIVL